MNTKLFALIGVLLLGCRSSDGEPQRDTTSESPDAAVSEPETPWSEPDLALWRPERIDLPPEFAPDLPIGEELLRFAPGMFDASAEDFWSYAFVMEVDQDGIDADALDAMFELYYDGLIAAVGEGKDFDVPANPATCSFASVTKTSFVGSIDLIDTFVTGDPLKLRVLVDTEPMDDGSTRLRVQASPKDKGHAVWRDLAFIASGLEL